MNHEFIHLESSLTVCGNVIKNRVVVPATADFGMTQTDGLINDRHLERYGSYADGGAGLIIIEACATSNIRETRNIIGLYSDDCLPGLRKLADVSKRNDAVALVQIKGPGLEYLPESSIENISHQRFRQYADDFLSAAIRCQKAGFHGIELHAAHGMYLNEILENSSRKDGYGGSFENRVRLLVELIDKIKTACGQDFIVAVRFGNPDLQELAETAAAVQKAGADLLDISTGKKAIKLFRPTFRLTVKSMQLHW